MSNQKGVLLVDMGGPRSEKEMKTFLSNMFKDPCILPLKKLPRSILSFIISTTRYKNSWKKYQLIGGTPLVKATQAMQETLQKTLPQHYQVKMAFSYNQPYIQEVLKSFEQEEIKDITIIPLYPQSSYTTTKSVRNDVQAVSKNLNIHFINEFYHYPLFTEFWASLIKNHIKERGYKNPLLMFSAHSIPEFNIKKGDTYEKALIDSSKMIAEHLNLEHILVYQSKLKRGNWIGLDVKEELKHFTNREVILIPISFINENLETLYDMDFDIIPYAKKELGYKYISRIQIPKANPIFINLLKNLIEE